MHISVTEMVADSAVTVLLVVTTFTDSDVHIAITLT